MKTVFIFGVDSLLCLTQEIVSSLDKIMDLGYRVIVGDDKGTSLLVQGYLSCKGYKKVTVYYTGLYPKNFYFSSMCQIPKGIQDRNMAMADLADYGLAIWDGVDAGIAAIIDKTKATTKVIKCPYLKKAAKQYTVYIQTEESIGYINKELFESLNKIILQKFNIVIQNTSDLDFLIQEYIKICCYSNIMVYSDTRSYDNGFYLVRKNPSSKRLGDYLIDISDYRLCVCDKTPELSCQDQRKKNIIYSKSMDDQFRITNEADFYLMSDIRGKMSPIVS